MCSIVYISEYLNRFFVVEGHKRVSVLRYFGALTVRAEVRRLLPARSKEPEILAYYEFLDFYRVTQIQYIVFRTPGRYPALLELLCGWPGAWFAQRVLRHKSVKMSFRIVFFVAVALNLDGLGFVVWWMARGT